MKQKNTKKAVKWLAIALVLVIAGSFFGKYV